MEMQKKLGMQKKEEGRQAKDGDGRMQGEKKGQDAKQKMGTQKKRGREAEQKIGIQKKRGGTPKRLGCHATG